MLAADRAELAIGNEQHVTVFAVDVVNLEQLCSRARHRGMAQTRVVISGVVASVAPDESAFAATGWEPADARRYFRHEARFGPAIWDVHEVAELEAAGANRSWAALTNQAHGG